MKKINVDKSNMFLFKLVILSCFLLGFVSCAKEVIYVTKEELVQKQQQEQKAQQVEEYCIRYKNAFGAQNVDVVVVNNHQFIVISSHTFNTHDDVVSIEHDPNCKCFKTNKGIEK